MFLRLEGTGETVEEERHSSSEKTEFRWKEFLRNLYYKHYKKWSLLTICFFFSVIPSLSFHETENLSSSTWWNSGVARAVESTLGTGGFVVPHVRGESLCGEVCPPLRQSQSEEESPALHRVGSL